MHYLDFGNATSRIIHATDKLTVHSGTISIESHDATAAGLNLPKPALAAVVSAEYHAPAERPPFKLTVDNVLDRLREDLATRRRYERERCIISLI